MLTVQEAAELADVKPAQLKLWLESGAFKPSMKSTSTALFGDATTYYFREEDIQRLRKFAVEQGQRKPSNGSKFVDVHPD